MKRRDFLKSTAAVAGATVTAPAIFSPAKAQARNETLLIVSESGPNNIDIHGVGTNVPGEEAIDVAEVLKRDSGPGWRSALK